MKKTPDTCSQQIALKSFKVSDDKLNPPSLRLNRAPVYGISEKNSVEGKNRREFFRFLLDHYGQKTTVHGLNRICQRKTSFMERIIWTFGFFAALYLLISMYAAFASRYWRKQFETTINDTFYPVFKVPFPEIVICNNNRLNWARLNESITKFLAPKHRTPQLERLFSNIVKRYNSLTVNTMFKLQGLTKKSLHVLNYINFTNVVDLMSWRCNEILSDCKWRLKSVNCCEIFFSRRTSLGQCLAFNSVLSKGGQKKSKSDQFWPWRYGHYGRRSGLQMRVLLEGESHSSYSKKSKGIVFMTIDRGAFSDYLFTPVRSNHIAHVSIWGSMSYMETIESSGSWDERGCVFDGELKSLKTLQGLPYQQENCVYECQRQQMIQSCNCTADLFFPLDAYPVCQLVDMPCLAQRWDNFCYSEATGEADNYREYNYPQTSCNCFFSCHSVLLENFVRIERIPLQKVVPRIGSYVDLDFYWRRSYIITYKTSLVFSWVDLLVSFGGIASLMLGCSLISVVELLVFLLFETPDLLRKKRRSDKRFQALQEKCTIQNLIDYDRTH